MLSRVFAAWLVVLIILPFSAPFSTCDAASLFASDDLADGAVSTIEPIGAAADAGTMHALPVRSAVRPLKPAGTPGRASIVPALLVNDRRMPHGATPLQSPDTQQVRPLRV